MMYEPGHPAGEKKPCGRAAESLPGLRWPVKGISRHNRYAFIPCSLDRCQRFHDFNGYAEDEAD